MKITDYDIDPYYMYNFSHNIVISDENRIIIHSLKLTGFEFISTVKKKDNCRYM